MERRVVAMSLLIDIQQIECGAHVLQPLVILMRGEQDLDIKLAIRS